MDGGSNHGAELRQSQLRLGLTDHSFRQLTDCCCHDNPTANTSLISYPTGWDVVEQADSAGCIQNPSQGGRRGQRLKIKCT